MVVGGLGFLTWSADAMSQSGTLTDDELRPLYAMDSDIRDGRDLATSTCAKCHGVDGLSTAKGVPNIAGQRPTYLYLELRAYQSGARQNADMTEKVKFLSDDAMVKVAAYYASLDPAQPPAGPAPEYVSPAVGWKAAATPCFKCHGDNGISQKAGVPNLVGQLPKYLVETMQSYVSEDRKLEATNEEMKTALAKLTDADLNQIALYYATQAETLTHAQTPIEGNPTVTKDSAARCIRCHGEDGVGTSPASPSIAGQDWTYMVRSLHAYKDGSRDDAVMGPPAKKLEDADMISLAAHYASLDPKPTGLTKPLSPTEWADKCDRCHGLNGNSARPDVPALAAQKQDYLEKALRAYKDGTRKNPEMLAMSGVLTEDDIKALAAYYAHQKARAAVFVMVPGR
jgi:cytochrome c553